MSEYIGCHKRKALMLLNSKKLYNDTLALYKGAVVHQIFGETMKTYGEILAELLEKTRREKVQFD